MAALSGEDPRAAQGMVTLGGADVGSAGPRARRKLGLHFVPEERLGRGAVPLLSLAQNTLLTRTETVSRSGWVAPGRVQRLAEELIARFHVRAGGAGASAKSLSGGNLQKFIVGREIAAGPKLLIVSQPTWGVDVGAAAQIRGELLKLRDEGCALLIVSEELDELFEISDRLLVIAKGRVIAQRAGGAGHRRADRRMDVGAVASPRWERDHVQAGNAPATVQADVAAVATAGAGGHRAHRRRPLRAAGQGPGARAAVCSSSNP